MSLPLLCTLLVLAYLLVRYLDNRRIEAELLRRYSLLRRAPRLIKRGGA